MLFTAGAIRRSIESVESTRVNPDGQSFVLGEVFPEIFQALYAVVTACEHAANNYDMLGPLSILDIINSHLYNYEGNPAFHIETTILAALTELEKESVSPVNDFERARAIAQVVKELNENG